MSWFQRKGKGSQGDQADAPAVDPADADGAGDQDARGEDAVGDGVEGDSGAGGGVEGEAGTGPARAASTGRGDAADLEQRRLAEGPYDESEADATVTRIDLGALRLPALQGLQLRLELEDKTKRVIAVTVTMADSSLQLQAFAAPRRDGIWDEIRSDIAAQVTRQGGTADDVPGVFGREVLARLPVRTPDGRSGHRATRFVGVDGPRWFLRGVFTGAAAVDEEAATVLEDLMRGVVVVRGSEAMAPRDLLQLKLPAQAQAQADAQAAARTQAAQGQGERGDAQGAEEASNGPAAAPRPGRDDDGRPPLAPFERGPEITEIR